MMKKMKKKIIIISAALVVVAALICAFLFAPKLTLDPKVVEENALKAPSTAKYLDGELDLSADGYTVVGSAGGNQLLYNEEDFTLKVVNTKTGYEWKSFIDEEDYIHNAHKGKTENTDSIAKKLKRLFVIGYTNFGAITDTESINEDDWADVTYDKLENGFAINARFSDSSICMTVEFWLDENGLNARIPRDKIKEEDKYGVVSITLLPMFGSTNDKVESGFMLFPDAIGSVYKIKPIDPEDRQSPVTADVYFPRDFNLDNIKDNNQQGMKNATMPFFGLGRENNGFVGYITEGEMNGYITMNPSGVRYNVNRVEAAVSYRKSYTYLNPSGKEVTETEQKISATDFAVHYSFASVEEGKKITYSDLANTLRSYLDKAGLLKKTESVKDAKVRTNLQMLMGTKAESMVAEFYQVMTKCGDIEKAIETLDAEQRANLRVMLLGWQSSGYNIYPSSGNVASGIGSIKDLSKNLEKIGIDTYVVDDLVHATLDSEDFEKQGDAVYNEAQLPITNSVGKEYVRNPYKEYKKYVEGTLSFFKNQGTTGVGFDKIGWYVFDDAQKRIGMNRFETASIYRGILNKTREAGLKTAVQRGNAYVLNVTDYLYDLPDSGSNYPIMDEYIPFYQMVVHGYIPYSLDIPGNMSIDYDVEKLKWIEKGAEPTFLLTEEMSEKFKDSKVENAFSTEILNWFDEVSEITTEFNTKLAFTGNCTIVEHTELQSEVYRLTYSNGNKVYVNYTGKQVTVDNVTVKAVDYTVVKADGSVLA